MPFEQGFGLWQPREHQRPSWARRKHVATHVEVFIVIDGNLLDAVPAEPSRKACRNQRRVNERQVPIQWRDHAHQEELKARSHIPKYSDGELERFAEHLAQTDEENL